MTTRTWNGATDTFSNAADWSGGVVPVAGDTAVINSGTVTLTGSLPTPLTINMDGANGPILVLAAATLTAGTSLLATDESNFVGVAVAGVSTNAGAVKFTGQAAGEGEIDFQDGPSGSTTSLVNTGGISVIGQQFVVLNEGVNGGNGLVNNGVLSFRSGNTVGNSEFVNVAVAGTGTIRLQPNTNLVLAGPVSAGQTIVLEAGSGNSTLSLGDGRDFNGVISGFGSSDQLQVSLTPYQSYTYALSNGIGTFTFLSSSGTTVGQVSFAGNNPQSAFTVSGPSNSVTTITTSVANQPSRISFTDINNGVAGNEAATVYTGPVTGLQYQYIWSSSDSVAMSASVPNVFLKGGAGNDALAVSGGNNVIDGGGGSNFLVGGTGNDTFFVDGRGGVVTWSSIVNFHEGDQATLFGFQAGVSTMPLTASDGAAGFTGVTIHSELNGAGTGVNESLTLAGLTEDDFNNHMTVTTGTLSPGTSSAINYLLIQYNH